MHTTKVNKLVHAKTNENLHPTIPMNRAKAKTVQPLDNTV